MPDAGAIVGRACAKYGWFDASTLKEPYRIEGKKTMGLELAEQFDWRPPEVILYPAGGGVGLIGLWKAFAELHELGWLDPDCNPRLVAVQADGNQSPIVRAFSPEGKAEVRAVAGRTRRSRRRNPHPEGTSATTSSYVPCASSGACVSVSDAEIVICPQLAGPGEGASRPP